MILVFLLALALLPMATSAAAPARCQVFVVPGKNIHVGQATLPAVWGEPLSVKLNKDKLLALAWVQTRYGVNPDYLLAIASKESRLNCQVNSDGCFQIEPGGFMGLTEAFPQHLKGASYDLVQNFGTGSVASALHLKQSYNLFQTWFNVKSFAKYAADKEAEAKILARAYNRGAWDQNIRDILTTHRASCRDRADLTSCYNEHEIVLDHTKAVVSICRTLAGAPTHNPLLIWADIDQLITQVIKPTEVGTRDWAKIISKAKRQFKQLRGRRTTVALTKIGPVLLAIAKAIPKQ